MEILKGSQGGQPEQITQADLQMIHGQSRKELEAEEIYTFSVRLCDNELDRDMERFSKQTLLELAPMFVGKSGIFDHSWTAKGQACRIYKTEVVQESTEDAHGYGEGVFYLKGYAYMVKTKSNEDLIAEIEAGIKREVSVGCAVAKSLCSICGGEMADCGHSKGEYYEGRRCYAQLEQATDAYEFSFVAVPAQAKAGVMKGFGTGAEQGAVLASLFAWLGEASAEGTLAGGKPGEKSVEQALSLLEAESKKLKKMGELPSSFEMAQLKKQVAEWISQAELGRKCLAELREEVQRLGALCQESFSAEMLEEMVGKMTVTELDAMKKLFGEKAGERYPVQTQLRYEEEEQSDLDGAFMI